ncbi:MAG: addiction module protein [Planctomycetaceae bacterium]
MSTTELFEQAKRLPVRERCELAHQLWDTLSDDQGVPTSEMPELSPAVVKELERRQELVTSGSYVAVDADESMARVRRALEEFRSS